MRNVRRGISRRAWELYVSTYERLKRDRLLSSKLGNNGEILSQVFSDLLRLEIHGLMGITEKHCVQLRKTLYEHRNALSTDPGEYFTIQEAEAVIDTIIACLDAGVVPQSTLFLGTDKDSREEQERLQRELEARGMIREGE